MPEKNLTTQLYDLTGQIMPRSPKEERALDEIREILAVALLHQNPSTVHNQDYLFRRSDLYAPSGVSDARLVKLDAIVKRAESRPKSNLQVFMRTLPVRTSELQGSVTNAGAGVRVVTNGPFLDSSGQDVYFDVVDTRKLIPLYVQGIGSPAILFKTSVTNMWFGSENMESVEITKNYTVEPDSVWISAKIFDQSADAACYCGLRVKGGNITLDADPQLQNGKLTISATTTVACDLMLEQSASFETDPTSPYGVDARNMTIHLPERFRFSFKGNTKTITEISPSSLTVFGCTAEFTYAGKQNCKHFPLLHRLIIPVKCEKTVLSVDSCHSPFFSLEGSAPIKASWWCLSVATIDTMAPPEADGNGALVISCDPGIDCASINLRNRRISLPAPYILAEPGGIAITDSASNGSGATMTFDMWQDETKRFGTSLECRLSDNTRLLYITSSNGNELAAGIAACRLQVDRPVRVDGTPVSISTKKSLWKLIAGKTQHKVVLADHDVLMDISPEGSKIPLVRSYGLAMHNALFTVTPPNDVTLFTHSNAEFTSLQKGELNLGFGLFSYLPTLPDPYAADLGMLTELFKFSTRSIDTEGQTDARMSLGNSVVWLWLFGKVKWDQQIAHGVSFNFAPLSAAFHVQKISSAKQEQPQEISHRSYLDIAKHSPFARLYADRVHRTAYVAHPMMSEIAAPEDVLTSGLHDFALLDVSSKANQMGVAFNFLNSIRQSMIGRLFDIDVRDESDASVYPIQVQGLDVVTKGMFAHAFAVPQMAWEPVVNITPPNFTPNNNPDQKPFDPPLGFNYYKNDGFPTRIGNFSTDLVPLSPIPLSKYLVETYRNRKDGRTYALFNLPFGMFTAAVLDGRSDQEQKPTIENLKPVFEHYVNGGIQLELTAGSSNNEGEDNLFSGMTIQLFNINRMNGSSHQESTLGHSGTKIFNQEFFINPYNLPGRPSSPVVRAGLSGYGASIFSDWHNRDAAYGQTSQALFNVVTGRTSREVVQVKSMIYPWGIRAVRSFTLFRLSNGYVCRIDSGWQAESDGLFDFRYRKVKKITNSEIIYEDTYKENNRYTFHPGIVHGLFNIRNIQETQKTYTYNGSDMVAVTFDADVKLEHVVEGGTANRVPSRGVLGYVQLLPQGEPIETEMFVDLLNFEKGSIGAEIACMIKVAGTEQRMRLDRVDVSSALDAGDESIFVVAARGSVVLPKEGSWTMVRHQRGTGEVTPLPDKLGVPLIREGEWKKDVVVDSSSAEALVRLANPRDLLHQPDALTINFGLLQNMNTQKVLFLTPSFNSSHESLLSKTPPLLADAFRLMSGNAIFPNIGDAESSFGSAIQLLNGVDSRDNTAHEAFKKLDGVKDLGAEVREIMKLDVKVEESGKVLDQEYKLIKNKTSSQINDAFRFDLPDFSHSFVDVTGLKIYVEYKATSKSGKKPEDYINYVGKFDFDVDSSASDTTKTWKGRMSSMQMVVDLGPIKRLLTIKGNFNSKKGSESNFGSAATHDFELPAPEIEYHEQLKPVIDILEVLASLSTGDYAEVMKKGLNIAMSNSANLWEYKFAATREIPLIRFPMGALYDSPQTPLKLEASLGLGIFFNAAMKVTSDPKQLLPTAGAYLTFHGGLYVMCCSLEVASIYAAGSVDLMLQADTSPTMSLDMKFGFGAQIVIGLPVIGNVSVLYMVGVEIYFDSEKKVAVSAFMLYRGHAELLGGLVGVTIAIEAKGTIEKIDDKTTNCIARMTFALDISIFLVIDISFSETWEEIRQIA